MKDKNSWIMYVLVPAFNIACWGIIICAGGFGGVCRG